MPSHKPQLISARKACALVASLVTATIMHAATVSQPGLLVGIIVDGLDAGKIQQLHSVLRPDGLRRLLDKGVSLEAIDFGPGADATASTAMLVTGAAPVVNGIQAFKCYDPAKKAEYPILAASSRSDFSNQAFTPASILVSTLSDEISIEGDGSGQIYAIAPEAWQAVILAGHAGTSACYIDDNSGQWQVPLYYTTINNVAKKRNTLFPLSQRLDTISWTPSSQLAQVPGLAGYKLQFPFKYTFKPKDTNRYRNFKASAPGNHEVTLTAIDVLESQKLGTRPTLDALNLAYTVTPYPYGKDADVEVEQLDAYLKLDADLAQLFQAIDRTCGMDKAVVYVSGLPEGYFASQVSEKYRVPTGQFSPSRAISLLNLYLMAIHGNGDYVTGYHNGYFYLNRDLIRDRGLSLQDIRIQAADFLSRMSGISETFTIDDIRAGRAGDNALKLRMNTSPNLVGDVLVYVNPGWEISEEETAGKKKAKNLNNKVIRAALTTAPAYILAPDIEPQTISQTQDARVLAPTVARLLRIRSPNAAPLPPLKL